MSRLLVVAPQVSGHRSTYLRLIISNARKEGWRVVLATEREALRTYQLEQPAPTSWPHEYVGVSSSRIDAIAELTRKVRPKITIVPDGDRTAAELGALGRWKGFGHLSLLVMRPDPGPRVLEIRPMVRRVIKPVLTKRATKVPNTTIKLLASALTSSGDSDRFVLDPIEYEPTGLPVAEVKRKLGIDGGRFWFAILGAISDRKCVPEVIEALEHCASIQAQKQESPPALLIAGQLSASVKQYIENPANQVKIQLKVVERRLSDQELDDAIRAVDCVVIAHRNEGPSGIMGKAAVSGSRVLASGAISLKRDCSVSTPGRKWAPLDTEELAEAAMRVQVEPRPEPIRVPSESEFFRSLSALQ